MDVLEPRLAPVAITCREQALEGVVTDESRVCGALHGAGQGARSMNPAYFETGEPMECDQTGSLCRSAIAYSLVTNRANVTFGDATARRIGSYREE